MVLHRRLLALLPMAAAALVTLASLSGDVAAQADDAGAPRDQAAGEPPVSRLRHLMMPDADRGAVAPPVESPAGPAAALLPEGPIDPASYPVGPGDRLQLVVWGAVEVTAALPVGPEGRIFVPNVGMVDVRDLTLAEARSRVIQEVRRTYSRVNVDLVLVSMRQFKVHVVGGVWTPGASFIASPMTRVSEVVHMAGGVLEKASRRRVVMHRPDGGEVLADLAGFELTGRLDLNPRVVDGAVIEVPRRTESILVSGAVVNPGTYEPLPGERLSDLMDAIGGFQPGADTDHIVFSHFVDDRTHEERVLAFVPGTDSGDPLLVDGDRVFVRTRPGFHQDAEVFVYGAVSKPGRHPIPITGRRLTEVLAAAGGFNGLESLSQAHILRPTERYVPPPEEADTRAFSVDQLGLDYSSAIDQLDSVYVACDFRALFETGDRAEDVVLYGGDVVHVPENRSEVRVIGYVKNPGAYPYLTGRSLGDYVDIAGGFDKDADKGRTRLASFAGAPLRRPIDDGDDIANGSVIYVPAKSRTGTLTRTRDIASIIVQLASLVVIVDRLKN